MAVENEATANLIIVKIGSSDYSRRIDISGMVENEVDVAQTLTFSLDQNMMVVSVPLINDMIALEETKEYHLSLQIPTDPIGVEIGNIQQTVLKVADDDGKPRCCDFKACRSP